MFLYFLSLGDGAGAGQVIVLSVGEVHEYKHTQTCTPNSSEEPVFVLISNMANLKAFFLSCVSVVVSAVVTGSYSNSCIVYSRGQTLDFWYIHLLQDTDDVHLDALKTAPSVHYLI